MEEKRETEEERKRRAVKKKEGKMEEGKDEDIQRGKRFERRGLEDKEGDKTRQKLRTETRRGQKERGEGR